jgi:hypothetical protein
MGIQLSSEEKLIDALSIRDTSDHTSIKSEIKGYIPKSIIIHNGLNQQVTIQVEGSIDDTFSNPLTVGNSFNIPANTDDYETLTDYIPFLRIKASCATAPTTGALTLYLAKVGG